MLERFKTWIVVFLIILIIYQLYSLWYTIPGDSNILTEIFTNKEKNSDMDYYFKPKNIIISFGNGQYTLVKESNMESSMIYSYVKEIYATIFNTKQEIKFANETIEELYSKKSIILEYEDNYDEEFKEIFNIKSDKIVREIEGIKKVIIRPELTINDKLKVYIQSRTNKIYEFNIETESAELYGLIDEINMFNTMNIFVLSSNEASKEYFETMVLIPVIFNDKSFIVNDSKVENPFKDESVMEEYANIFFENPMAKWKMQKDNNIIIYGDGEKSVRIYKDSYIEYVSNVEKTMEVFSLKDSIEVAMKFFNKEIYPLGEIYLADVEKIADDEYKLCYNYKVNGLDEIIEKSFMNQHEINYPIEIVVSHGKVSSYKRLVQKIIEKETKSNDQNIQTQNEDVQNEVNAIKQNIISDDAIVSYNEILDIIAGEKDDSKIKSMQIAYYKEKTNDSTKLVWYIEREDKRVEIFDVVRR